MEKNILKSLPTASKILIIGGFGFVGSKLLQLLRGYNVTVLDNLMYGNRLHTDTPFIFGDVRNRALIKSIIPNYDIIIHLAGIVGEPSCILDTRISHNINVQGTYNITDHLNYDQKFIFLSSTSVYGNIDNHVAHEGINTRPNNNYAVHKACGELSTKMSLAEWIILRPVSAFGLSSRIRMDLIANNFIYQALTSKKIKVYQPEIYRPIVHVFDFARVIKYAIDDLLAWNEIYNVCDPNLHFTKIRLAERISELTGAEIVTIQGKDLDMRDYAIESEKLLESGFVYSSNPLQRAIEEIDINLEIIQENPEKYQTTEIFRQFLSKERMHV